MIFDNICIAGNQGKQHNLTDRRWPRHSITCSLYSKYFLGLIHRAMLHICTCSLFGDCCKFL